MSRRPLATVRVLNLPHIAPDAVRVEVECPASTTGITSLPGPHRLEVPALITAACYAHQERCGQCDTSEAHACGSRAMREETERLFAAVQAERRRRRADGRRN
jgi:hypothetical protein